MPVVTRNMIWFQAGDIPYVDFEFNGVSIFFDFKKSLTYCIPDGRKKAMWPGGPSAARDDGMDLTVKSWCFWLIADDIAEMSCSYSGAHGPEFHFYNKEHGITITRRITENEAKQIKQAVEDMVKDAKKDDKFPRDETIHVLKPSYTVMSYPVKAYRWTAKQRYTTDRVYTPVWNPEVEGY